MDQTISEATNPKEYSWIDLLPGQEKYHDYEFPAVTIVIPTFNNSQTISLTLDSVLDQNYPNYEVLIIDADSSDRTLEIVKSYRNNRIHIISVTNFQRYEMLNRGISQAKGMYINFLFPGDFFIHRNAIRYMMSLALENERPEMVYCGTLLRDSNDVKIMYRILTQELLHLGQQPTSLQSCWFLSEALRKVGKFDTHFKLRGGFDLMCRICLAEEMRIVSEFRVLTDFEFRVVTRAMVYNHFVETMHVIDKYFGKVAVLHWLFKQKDMRRLFKLSMKSVRVAFLGK